MLFLWDNKVVYLPLVKQDLADETLFLSHWQIISWIESNKLFHQNVVAINAIQSHPITPTIILTKERNNLYSCKMVHFVIVLTGFRFFIDIVFLVFGTIVDNVFRENFKFTQFFSRQCYVWIEVNNDLKLSTITRPLFSW